jgi:polygalacturonase
LPPVNAAGVRVPGGGGLAPPRSLVFQNCENVHVAGLHLLNEARWGYVFIYCQNVLAENLTAFTDTRIPSSDGMDVDSCQHVHITGCSFDDGDDDISIKSGKDEDGRRVNIPCEDILIEKCHFGRGDGGAAMGSETSGGIRNVTVRDCVADNGNAAPVRIKTNFTRGGVIENITYENITYNDVNRCYEINLNWTATSSAGPRMPPVLRNVKIINCSGLGDSAGVINGLPDSLISHITFENCHVTTYTGITVDNVTDDVIASLQGPGLKIDSEDGQPLILRQTAPDAPAAAAPPDGQPAPAGR